MELCMYSVVQREAIEVLAEYPDDVTVKHWLPRPSSGGQKSSLLAGFCRPVTLFFPRRPLHTEYYLAQYQHIRGRCFCFLSPENRKDSEMRGLPLGHVRAPTSHHCFCSSSPSGRCGAHTDELENGGGVLGGAGKRDRRAQRFFHVTPHNQGVVGNEQDARHLIGVGLFFNGQRPGICLSRTPIRADRGKECGGLRKGVVGLEPDS